MTTPHRIILAWAVASAALVLFPRWEFEVVTLGGTRVPGAFIDIPDGSPLTERDLREQDWPQGYHAPLWSAPRDSPIALPEGMEWTGGEAGGFTTGFRVDDKRLGITLGCVALVALVALRFTRSQPPSDAPD